MGDRQRNANQRRLEQLRAMRDVALPEPTPEDKIADLESRIADLEAENERLRALLQATRPTPEGKSASLSSPIHPS